MPEIELAESDATLVRQILGSIMPDETRVLVFGSRAKGGVKRSSGLDLAIDAGRPLTRAEELALADAFEESDLPYRVDVVDLASVNDPFRSTILRDALPLKMTS